MNRSILFLSFRWNDDRLKMHSSDLMISIGFKNNGWDVYYHDYRETTLKLGHKENQNEIYRQIMEIKPDILFINKGEKIDPQTILKCKREGYKGKIIGWYADVRRNPVNCVLDIMRVCDWFFHCIGGEELKRYYKQTKCPCSFLFSPCEPTYVQPIDLQKRDLNITWFGQLYDNKNDFDSIRRDIIPSIRHLLSDYGACFDRTFFRGSDYYQRLGRSKLSISIPAINLPFYFSNRQSHIMGSECVVLSYKFKNCFDIFKENFNIITFENADELINKAQYYLNNLDHLEYIQKNTIDFFKKYLTSSEIYNEIMFTLSNGESSYMFGQTINPKKRKVYA